MIGVPITINGQPLVRCLSRNGARPGHDSPVQQIRKNTLRSILLASTWPGWHGTTRDLMRLVWAKDATYTYRAVAYAAKQLVSEGTLEQKCGRAPSVRGRTSYWVRGGSPPGMQEAAVETPLLGAM